MGEKDEPASFTDGDEKTEHARPMTNSSTEADLDDDRHSREAHNPALHKETEDVVGTPDIDHEEIEEAVPGHELDVELAKVSYAPCHPALSIVRNPRLGKPLGTRLQHPGLCFVHSFLRHG
jgi:hypothetical protein